MRAVGIVAEYNPFHLGHKYHIEQTRAKLGDVAVVACMSGNYVQRGEAAAIDKFTRAEAAVYGGVDLVVELPLLFSLASAERFASGAVELLDSLGCCDYLSFGSETDDTKALFALADYLLDEKVVERIVQKCGLGLSFAASREAVMGEIDMKLSSLLKSPNNILAVEYIKAIKKNEYALSPLAIKRTGALHDSESTSEYYASASYIRKAGLYESRKYIPAEAYSVYDKKISRNAIVANGGFETPILSYLRRLTPEDYLLLPECREGLHHRIDNAVRKSTSVSEILAATKSKRYPEARIRRMLLYAYLNISSELFREIKKPPYIRILAFNDKGRMLLREIKTRSPLITKAASIYKLNSTKSTDNTSNTSNTSSTSSTDKTAQKCFAAEVLADDLYNAVMINPDERIQGSDFLISPIYVKSQPLPLR